MVLKSGVMEMYSRVSRFLLQATYAKELCQGLYYGTDRNCRGETPLASRQLAALHFFSRGLHEYLSFQCVVAGGGPKALIRQLRKSGNVR